MKKTVAYKQREISILKFLDLAEPASVPANMKTLRFFFRSLSDRDLYNALQQSQRHHRIETRGERRHYLYFISNEGRKYLLRYVSRQLEKEFRTNVRNITRNVVDKPKLNSPQPTLEKEVLA